MSDKIFVFDEIVVNEARSKQIETAYATEYAPTAKARGMTFQAAWRSPAVVLQGQSVTLYFLWHVPNVQSWWKMRHADVDSKTAWWAFIDTIIQSRKRSYMVELAGLEADV